MLVPCRDSKAEDSMQDSPDNVCRETSIESQWAFLLECLKEAITKALVWHGAIWVPRHFLDASLHKIKWQTACAGKETCKDVGTQQPHHERADCQSPGSDEGVAVNFSTNDNSISAEFMKAAHGSTTDPWLRKRPGCWPQLDYLRRTHSDLDTILWHRMCYQLQVRCNGQLQRQKPLTYLSQDMRHDCRRLMNPTDLR